MSIPVILGLDASPTKVGWGLLRDDTGAPVACGVQTLDGSPESTRDAISTINLTLDLHGASPIFSWVERPVGGVGNSDSAMKAGEALGMVIYASRAYWPWLTIARAETNKWRGLNGIPTRAPKGLPGRDANRKWFKQKAIERATALGFELPIVGKRVLRPSDDAAEGACIAWAAWAALEANPAWRVAA